MAPPIARITVYLALASFASATNAHAQVRVFLDDHFDDGNIETGGVRGGIYYVGTAEEEDVILTEQNSVLTISSSGHNDHHVGIVSREFNARAQERFTASFDVQQVGDHPQGSGHFLGVTDDAEIFYRESKNFGLVFFGDEDQTGSSQGFSLVINDVGEAGADVILASQPIELESYLNGFQAFVSASRDGWSYGILGLNDVHGAPTIFSERAGWETSGFDPTDALFFYEEFFDEAEHAVASASTQDLTLGHGYDRIAVAEMSGLISAGDADLDGDFDQLDLVQVQIAGKYLTGQPATWGEGDWNSTLILFRQDDTPPAGDGLFDQLDIVAALEAGTYVTGPFASRLKNQHHAIPEASTFSLSLLAIASWLGGSVRFRRTS